MRAFTKFALPAVLLGALGACSTGYDSGVDVTRFHLDQPAARGMVFIEPQVPEQAGTLEFQAVSAPIAQVLQTTGFTITPDRDKAELIASVDFSQTTREAAQQRSPVTVGVGGGTGGRNVGIGGGVSFPLGSAKPNEIVTNLLQVRLMRTSDESTIWEGRASDDVRFGQPGSSLADSVPQLAASLFRDYPGQSGETVTYRD